MRIKRMLESLLESLKQPENRGVGHTQNAVEFAKSINALYVMPTISSFQIVDKQFGNSKSLISFTHIENGALRSIRGRPLVLDNYAVNTIIEESLRGFRALEDMVHASENVAHRAQVEANQLRSELEDLKAQNIKLKKVIDKFNKKTGKK